MKFLPKNMQNLDQKVNQRQNTVCLEQQIYASLKNFTPTLLLMLETFRRSADTAFQGCRELVSFHLEHVVPVLKKGERIFFVCSVIQ